MTDYDLARQLRPIELKMRSLEKSIYELQLATKYTQRIMVKLEDHMSNFDNRVENVYNLVNDSFRFE